MINILYFSVAIIAISFLVLVIYLSRTFNSLKITLDNVSSTLTGLEKQLDGVMSETNDLLKKTNALADDISDKAESLNSVVTAVKDVGGSIQKFSHTLQTVTDTLDRGVEQNQEKISQVVQWSTAIMELKEKWKTKKQLKQQKQALDPKPQPTGQRMRDH